MMQSLLPAIYPILKAAYHLDFTQIGPLTLTYQLTATLLQPVIGFYTDKRPQPYSLPVGMMFTLAGLVSLSLAHFFGALLASAALLGMGSAVFHPESSRVARMASGGQHGLAQSLFQVGGNTGTATGPLLAAFIVLPRGQGSVALFSLLLALMGIVILARVSSWYQGRHDDRRHSRRGEGCGPALFTGQDFRSLADPRRAHLLEILLSGEPDQLLRRSIS